jgi:hypothetical protein
MKYDSLSSYARRLKIYPRQYPLTLLWGEEEEEVGYPLLLLREVLAPQAHQVVVEKVLLVARRVMYKFPMSSVRRKSNRTFLKMFLPQSMLFHLK